MGTVSKGGGLLIDKEGMHVTGRFQLLSQNIFPCIRIEGRMENEMAIKVGKLYQEVKWVNYVCPVLPKGNLVDICVDSGTRNSGFKPGWFSLL